MEHSAHGDDYRKETNKEVEDKLLIEMKFRNAIPSHTTSTRLAKTIVLFDAEIESHRVLLVKLCNNNDVETVIDYLKKLRNIPKEVRIRVLDSTLRQGEQARSLMPGATKSNGRRKQIFPCTSLERSKKSKVKK